MMQMEQENPSADYMYADTQDVSGRHPHVNAANAVISGSEKTELDNVVLEVYAEVQKTKKSEKSHAAEENVDGEYDVYGPAPIVPDKKF